MYIQMHGWMDGWTDGQMDGWMWTMQKTTTSSGIFSTLNLSFKQDNQLVCVSSMFVRACVRVCE